MNAKIHDEVNVVEFEWTKLRAHLGMFCLAINENYNVTASNGILLTYIKKQNKK